MPRPYVDHHLPRSAFRAALERAQPRLLTIAADSGKGKTRLLASFWQTCKEHNVPVALLDFKSLHGQDAFAVLKLMRRSWRALDLKTYDAAEFWYRYILLPSGSSVPMTPQHESLAQLREILATRFDEGELRTLCFDLGIDYADLPGEGKANKARELVAYLGRRGRFSELAAIGRRFRLDVSWDSLLEMAKETQPTFQGSSVEWSSYTSDAFDIGSQRRQYILSELTSDLLLDLARYTNHRVVLLVDTYEQADDDIQAWISGEVIYSSLNVSNLVVVAAGRQVPEIEQVYWQDLFRHFDLPAGLTCEDWLEYAQNVGASKFLNEDALRRYHAHYQGDPKFMCEICDPLWAETL